MADRTTFFIIDRCIFDNELWNEKPFDHLHAWIYLIGHANYADSKRIYKGKLQRTCRGQLQTSYQKLADDWGWSRGKVLRFLKLLESDEMIRINGTSLGTTLTIENYSKFQDLRNSNGTALGTPDGTALGTALGTHKNKENKGNKENNSSLHEKPSREEVCDYVSSLDMGIDWQDFYNYMEDCGWTDASGKPIRSWKAMARRWKNNPNSPTYQKKKRPIDLMLEKALAEEKARKEAEARDTSGSNDTGLLVTEHLFKSI